ncbi:transcriptional regulator [Sphaerisporangium rufum]|uniref:Transcriptional regulator n=1 Tax=Sphaerisporangium rufum TaxID=1381558 RepID=A0A919RAA2_9ACTN|nr:TetR/AcrR family transcriptional regulator [Sphaerisporangium rufum]GII80225.1 transcriptional regulator [Sphaerisporangium rufum]
MPKIVDHEQRRRELAEAVWRVIARDGVAEVSMRTVAAEAGWSSGALRHYFSTRDGLLAFACELVIERVTERITALRHTGTPREAVRAILLETMPVDAERRAEASVAFAFVALGLTDAELAEVKRLSFTGMYELCLRLVTEMANIGALAEPHPPLETSARRLHAVVDGLTLHVLAGHLTPAEMTAEFDAYLAELIPDRPAPAPVHP